MQIGADINFKKTVSEEKLFFHHFPKKRITRYVMMILPMPNIKSAKKRDEINARNNKKNTELKSKVRTLIKACLVAATSKDEKAIDEKLAKAYQAIDKASKGSTFHKNKAARLKSRLVQRIRVLKSETVK
jgi:small subunit ribosomal protein S20